MVKIKNYKTLVQQTLPILRKKQSQLTVSHLMKYKHNQVYRWESARAQIHWKDFVELCHVCKAPLKKALGDCYTYKGSFQNTHKLLTHFLGNKTQAEISKKLKISRQRVGRLIRGQAEPTVEEVFKILDSYSAIFLAFLDRLLEGKEPAVLSGELQRHRRQKEYFFSSPWMSLISCALILPEYDELTTHSHFWVAQKTGLSVSRVEASILEMEDLELIVKVDKKYKSNLNLFSPRGTIDQRRQGFLFWNALAFNAIKLAYAQPNVRTSWDVFNISDKGYEEIESKWAQFLASTSEIIQKEEDLVQLQKGSLKQRTYVSCMNLVSVTALSNLESVFKLFQSSK